MKLFRGKFNFQGQIFGLWTKAQKEEEAFTNFINQLEQILSVSRSKLYAYFKMDKRKKYEVKEVEE